MSPSLLKILRFLPLALIAAGAYYWSQQQWDPTEGEQSETAELAIRGIGKRAFNFQLQQWKSEKPFNFKSLKGKAIAICNNNQVLTF